MINLLHKYRLDHIAFGWLIIVPVYLLTDSALIAWLAQSFYWLGREIRDMEVKLRVKLPDEWYIAWKPKWWIRKSRRDNLLDFVNPVVGNGAILGVFVWLI